MAAERDDPGAALASVPARVSALHRPRREALFLPVLRSLVGPLDGLHAIELGAGEPLLLASALVAEGLHVDAVDPALVGRASPHAHLDLHARDAIDDPPTLPPATLTLSSMLFGAPLRQRARRALWPRYVVGDRPSEQEVHDQLQALEGALIHRLAVWTAPGGWSVHWSLEGLFAAGDDAWRDAGFERPLRAPSWLLARRTPMT